MTTVIETGIPVPLEAPKPRGSGARYPWGELRPGQSFFVDQIGDTKAQPRLLVILMRAQVATKNKFYRLRHMPNKFLCSVEGDGVRVWRVDGV